MYRKHVVFGKCIHGMGVLKILERCATDKGDKPRLPVTITGVCLFT
jgi:cyclophilin family peptidyl-prolyl cis-trans isomerase